MQEEINQLEGWRHENDALCRDFVFDDFVQAFSFMTRVALFAEKMDHHPNWVNLQPRVYSADKPRRGQHSFLERY